MRTIPTLLLVLAALLAACAPVGSRELHEVVLIRPQHATVLRYAYGDADRMVLNERERDLGAVVGDRGEGIDFAVMGARAIDGDAFLRTTVDRSFEAPLGVARIPLSSDLRVTTRAPVARALYYDGSRWLDLGSDLQAGRSLTVVPAPAPGGLRGLGDLTPAEGDAIAAALQPTAPLVVALLPEETVADTTGVGELAAAAPDGLEEYRHTALWIQSGLSTDASAYAPPPAASIVDVVARGDQGEDPGEDAFVLIRDEASLREFWNAVHAASFDPPPLPEADFRRETLLGVRLAQRPSGGYGIAFESVTREGGELFADVRLSEPEAGDLVTQALTTPWLLVRVLGVEAPVVWFRDAASGELIAVARTDTAGGF